MEKDNQHLDQLLKDQFKELPLDIPSNDFTKLVMREVVKEEKKLTTQSLPLISNKVWGLVAAVLVALIFIPFKKQEGGILEKVSLDFSFFENVTLPTYEGAAVSNTMLYAAVLFSIMMFAQVFYLKGYFDKKMNA